MIQVSKERPTYDSRLVRDAVVRHIGKKPSKTEFAPLLDMLGDPEDDVRSLASNCLARYPEKVSEVYRRRPK